MAAQPQFISPRVHSFHYSALDTAGRYTGLALPYCDAVYLKLTFFALLLTLIDRRE